jgi:hypothetical protein
MMTSWLSCFRRASGDARHYAVVRAGWRAVQMQQHWALANPQRRWGIVGVDVRGQNLQLPVARG